MCHHFCTFSKKCNFTHCHLEKCLNLYFFPILDQCTMNKTGSNSGHFVKYWVKLTLLKYTNKMVISDQKRKINGTAPKIPKVYQVWQLSCYSTQLEKLNLGAFLKMATNWTSFVHGAMCLAMRELSTVICHIKIWFLIGVLSF